MCVCVCVCVCVCMHVCVFVCMYSAQVALMVKNLPAIVGDVRDAGQIPGLGRSPGGHGYTH